MPRTKPFEEQKGFLTFAQNNSTTDYLSLAYCQALSIKCTQHHATSFAVIVDQPTKALITDKHREVFDYVVDLDEDASANDEWKLKNEWQAWWLTPFKETIKIESDILLVDSIDHWWAGMQEREVGLTNKIRDVEGNVSDCRSYRVLFDDNHLPDTYSGLMYFRYGAKSRMFFIYAKHVYEHWKYFKDKLLVNCRDEEPTTDVVFAIAAKMLGEEECINPALPYPSFTHMKGAINGWGISTDWTEKIYAQLDQALHLTVGFTRQQYPFHYQQKKFITPTIIKTYEEAYHRIKQ